MFFGVERQCNKMHAFPLVIRRKDTVAGMVGRPRTTEEQQLLR